MITEDAMHDIVRQAVPQVLGALVRQHGDFGACEDAVQEALLAAVEQWPAAGVPKNPQGWLFTVASRRLNDQYRSDLARRRREATALPSTHEQSPDIDIPGVSNQDDLLILLFLCCQPSLPPVSQAALTLRAVGGLTTKQIAHAFLTNESAMARRITRAKQQIKASGMRFQLPENDWASRLSVVLQVLYLIFNEGYVTTSGDELQRSDLTSEAIWLTREVHRLLPENTEVTGLLALMLLTEARRAARTSQDGTLIPLEEQDRNKWDKDVIEEGIALVTSALSAGSSGPYQLQAAIAAIHAEATSAQDTDWPQILGLYDILQRMLPSPVVALNRAVAVAMVHGPHAALELLASLDSDPRLAGGHRVEATRAHLLEMAGDYAAARASYSLAASRTASVPEQRYLASRAARLD